MKIDINKVKQIPKGLSDKFGMCVYGSPSDEIKEWINFHKMEIKQEEKYINIFTDKNIDHLFNMSPHFKYLDGFSPNLNKHLHIGHFSNLVLAKAFYNLGFANEKIAILGDTLEGEVSKEEALAVLLDICNKFEYDINQVFMASEMKLEKLFGYYCMQDGTEEYEGTKIFEIGDKKIVGIKSDGTTSYFYQDCVLACTLNDSTLYLTGNEQTQHFELLKEKFPHIKHIGLGLVKSKSKKMSSRFLNVIWMKDVLEYLMETFDNNEKLCYNVFAGLILKSTPKSDKNIDFDEIKNPLNSQGLYLSYTLAKLKSAGCNIYPYNNFKSQDLQFKYLKALDSFMPNVLFDGLLDHAKKISSLYATHKIKDNPENKLMFEELGNDLLTGMMSLGLFDIDKV